MSRDNNDSTRSEIYRRFRVYVMGQRPDLSGYKRTHDGAEGDWLTRKMGLTVNGDNEPDFDGFEMKKDSQKVSFGDWSPNIALYPGRGRCGELTRIDFLRAFGVTRIDAGRAGGDRYSWSGDAFPKVGLTNKSGQNLSVSIDGDISVTYSYSKDTRPYRTDVVPSRYREAEVKLVVWTSDYMRIRVESKFNVRGWFICLKNKRGEYDRLLFGPPLNYERFLYLVRTGVAYCDCGMHSDTSRPYMTWRAAKSVWESLADTP